MSGQGTRYIQHTHTHIHIYMCVCVCVYIYIYIYICAYIKHDKLTLIISTQLLSLCVLFPVMDVAVAAGRTLATDLRL